jgi:hypothetical protein
MLQPPVWESLAATTGQASLAPCTASVHCAAAAGLWWASPAVWGVQCQDTQKWCATFWKVSRHGCRRAHTAFAVATGRLGHQCQSCAQWMRGGGAITSIQRAWQCCLAGLFTSWLYLHVRMCAGRTSTKHFNVVHRRMNNRSTNLYHGPLLQLWGFTDWPRLLVLMCAAQPTCQFCSSVARVLARPQRSVRLRALSLTSCTSAL